VTLLEVRGLTKHYPGARALDGVDFDVEPGQVHCLVGQNGAGKSTLIKCVSGLVEPTSGEVLFEGEPLPVGQPAASLARGVATIYQELDLVDDLTVAENLFLGHELATGRLFVDRRRTRRRAREALGRLGHTDIRPETLVGALKPAQKQLVSIARALTRDVRLLVMDEPTAVLDDHEVEVLFGVVRRLAAEGVGVIYISHRLEEVARIGDTITVLKDGRTVARGLPPTTPTAELVRFMVGRDLEAVFPDRSDREPGPVALRVEGLRRPPAVVDATFEVRAGEIVGIAGLVGAGRTELLRLIAGLDTRQGGLVEVDGRTLPAGHPRAAVRAGVGLAPEERKADGLWPAWNLVKNVTVADLARFRTGPFVDRAGESREAARQLEVLDTRPRDVRRLVTELSGGNQQKVVLARWLLRHCKVLLLDEPTRGVDVGAKAEIYRVVRVLADGGLAIVMVSSELNELIGLCDRLLVMRDGHIVAELAGPSTTEEQILTYAVHTGGEEASA
jgi:ribose transport system ATP-binding protein